MERIPGMLDRVPTENELSLIDNYVGNLDVDELMNVMVTGMPQLPDLSPYYKEAAEKEYKEREANQDLPN